MPEAKRAQEANKMQNIDAAKAQRSDASQRVVSRLVHIGKGRVRVETDIIIDPSLDVPKVPQKLSGVAAYYKRNPDFSRDTSKAVTYGPTPFHHAAGDQCKFPAPGGRCCGSQIVRGRSSQSYCHRHYAVVYGRPA